MSYTSGGSAAYCEKLLYDLSQINTSNDPQMLSGGFGMVQALLDPENTNGTQITQVDQGNGHIRELRIKSKQRGTATVVQGNGDCAQGTAAPWFEQEFFPTQRQTIKIGLDLDDVRRYCADASTPVAIPGAVGAPNVTRQHLNDVLKQLHALRVEMDQKLIRSAIPYFGTVSDTTSVTNTGGAINVDLFLTGSKKEAIASGYMTMLAIAEDAEQMGTPFAVGAGLLRDYTNYLELGCCNDGGFDFGQMRGAPGFKFYYDKYVGQNAQLGAANEFIMWTPGNLVLGTYLENRGSFAGRIDNVTYFTLPDPQIPGLVYDARLIEDGCGRRYTLEVSTPYYDLFGTASFAFATADDLNGVTGVWNMLARAVA